VTLLRGQTTDSEGRIRPAVIREARECLKHAAIERVNGMKSNCTQSIPGRI
jgi:hypothetical protein